MSQIKIKVYDTVIDYIKEEPYKTALEKFHGTLTTITNGQSEGDYVVFTDGNKVHEGQGKIDKFLKISAIIELYVGFGGGAVALGNLPFPFITMEGVELYAVMKKSFFEDETNTVPSGFINDTWTEVVDDVEIVHNTSWKKWVELAERTPRESLHGLEADKEVMFGLKTFSKLLKDSDIFLLNSTYDIFDLDNTSPTYRQFKANTNIKLYTNKGIKELMQTIDWTNE